MEAVLLGSSGDQSISSYKYNIRNPRKNYGSFISRPCENLAPASFQRGVLHTPPFSQSYTFSKQQSLPPLLPLPISKPFNNNYNVKNKALSCSQVNKKPKHQSFTPKKISKPKMAEPNMDMMMGSTDRLGPDPGLLPKEFSGVLSSSASSPKGNSNKNVNGVSTLFSGSAVFALSPPPSSLPLPTFSLRPKLSCNVVAGGIDAGATDGLRRLLRLR